MKKRTIALYMAAVMLFGAVVGGTIAWLQDDTDPVVNTFTFGDINISLDEKNVDEDKYDNEGNLVITPTEGQEVTTPVRDKTNDYDLIPGDTAFKDPKVTVKAGSEKCYVFIKVTEEKNSIKVKDSTEKVISYTINDKNWLLVGGTQNLYVYAVDGRNATKVDATKANIVTASILTAYDSNDNVVEATIDEKGNSEYDESKIDHHIDVNENLTKEDIEAMNKLGDYPKVSFDACAVQSENIEYSEVVTIAKNMLMIQ